MMTDHGELFGKLGRILVLTLLGEAIGAACAVLLLLTGHGLLAATLTVAFGGGCGLLLAASLNLYCASQSEPRLGNLDPQKTGIQDV